LDKCSQTISDKCTQILANYVRDSNIVISDKLSFSSTFKFSIINEPSISVEASEGNEFSVYVGSDGVIDVNNSVIAEARVSDFLLGAARVRSQYEDLAKMKSSGTSSAWLLVSTYYCAYFSCVEIAKLFDRISMSLAKDDFKDLRAKAFGDFHAELFNNDNLKSENLNFVGGYYAGKIVFRTVGTRPHSAAWSNVLYAMRQIFSKKNWPEADRLINLLNDPEVSPSRIRNDWNYKRTDYFGISGESIGAEFKKLIANNGAAISWLTRRYPHIACDDPCIIAYLCESFAPAVIDAARRIREVIRVDNS
jgi:hypothetical protein